MTPPPASPLDPETFLARWAGADGSELANYQLFVGDLCRLLDVPLPEPAREDTRDNAYVFERRVQFAHGDGSTSAGRIDCCRRGVFVLEAKKVKRGQHTKGFDEALLRARAQPRHTRARCPPPSAARPSSWWSTSATSSSCTPRLWIGYLQWHIRTFGHASVAEPVIHDYRNIEHRDAVLGCAGMTSSVDHSTPGA